MRLFNFFENIAHNHEGLQKRIANLHDYWAHTHKSDHPETLEKHIALVNKYALNLIKEHGLESVIEQLIVEITDNQEFIKNREAVNNFIKTLFLMSIEFHDYGKINPNFQLERMGNDLFSYDKNIKIDTQHSRLSAYLFFNHFAMEIEKNSTYSDEEMVFLGIMTFLFTNPILKHHATYFEHDGTWYKDVNKSIFHFLKIANIPCSDDSLINVFKEWNEQLSEFYKPKSYFPIFALLKLNFSLLTASDYLATSEFMNGFLITDFGLVTKERKERWYKQFWEEDKFSNGDNNYNKELKERFEFYKRLKINDLKDRSKINLNLLRQKLSAEVLENLRQNQHSNLFYLEAPTGAGKTNMSLAIALDLMKEKENLNKVVYVFPFNTLITQTYQGIIDVLGLKEDEIIQLHSKSGFHSKDKKPNEEGEYGNEKLNYIDNLFINYPITLLSHIRFFDILKGNNKETNYILHRLSNSVIIIDELQAYNPQHWDKVILFLHEYAHYFNFKVIMMSATLPHLDDLLFDETTKGKVTKLVTNKNDFFTNPNFAGRVEFDFTLKNDNELKKLDKDVYLERLRTLMFEKSEEYAANNDKKVRVIIEFIKKKSASEFLQSLEQDIRFADYQKYIISGEILETRRQQIIKNIKKNTDEKVILVSTQVVEAGVNIDMDLGFKDTSLVDSDEQLAGRVNRNASKENCKVYIFDFDNEKGIYGSDFRYKMKLQNNDYQNILSNKDFGLLYQKVKDFINENNKDENKVGNLLEYLGYFKRYQFKEIHQNFKLIDEANTSVFIPLNIPYSHFEKMDKDLLEKLNIQADNEGNISGADVWDKYYNTILQSKDRNSDFIKTQIALKQINGLLSKFMFSVYKFQEENIKSLGIVDKDIFEKTSILYINDYFNFYDYRMGIVSEVLDKPYAIC